jgi:hypothetical protein
MWQRLGPPNRPDSGEAHLALAQHLYWGYGDYDRGRQELTIARAVLPNEPLVLVASIDRRQVAGRNRSSDIPSGRQPEDSPACFRCAETFRVSHVPASPAIHDALGHEYLGVIYAWSGVALDQIAAVMQVPSDLSYGQLRVHPYWDPLRGDPHFEKMIASLAPDRPKAAGSH